MTDLAHRIVGHYEKHAAVWDRDRQSASYNDRIWHDRFIAMLPAGARVLDLGCGPGRPVAAHLAAHGLRVTGVDSSPAMIAICRERLPDQDWIVADMRTLALGRTFNGIVAWDSFFHLHFDDQRHMFDVFAAHASADAVLLFNAGPGYGERIGSYRGEPLYHASLAGEEYEVLLARHGFLVVGHVANDPRAGGRTAWLCRREAGPKRHLGHA